MIQSIEEGRKEDGNRSIADKIIKRLHDLEMTVQTNFGRWAWELLQNAKDSVAESHREVSVKIIFDNGKIEFLHNGDYFTEKDNLFHHFMLNGYTALKKPAVSVA